MKDKRKRIVDYILTVMKRVTKDGRNYDIYKNLFDSMNDNQFKDFMDALVNGGNLTIFASNDTKKGGVDYDDVVSLCKELGLNIMQRLYIYDEDTGLQYLTPYEYIVGTVEVRKQRQTQIKKFGGAENDTQIDDLTGQVFGDSRGCGISIPEIRVLENIGLHRTALELYDVKGGDLGALEKYRSSLQETGSASLEESLKNGTKVKSLVTASYLLKGRHISNNVGER